VQLVPTLAAEPLDHLVRGSDGQWDHEKEREHADGDERSLHHVTWDRFQSEEAIVAVAEAASAVPRMKFRRLR
jgi:hypothetical protein